MLKWEKKGKIFNPKLITENNSHSQVPFGVLIDGIFRVFFTSRPPKNVDGTYVSYIYYVDFDPNDLTKIIDVKKEPVLSLGVVGTFDEFGTMPCSVVEHNSDYYMYYVGWTRMLSIPYSCANGLAISKDKGKTFNRYSSGPILSQSPENPFLVGCPRVYKFNNKFYMWYIGGTGWLQGTDILEPLYKIKVATSSDGINWKTINNDLISPKYENECQTSVTVFQYNGIYHMYFTYRHAVDFRNPERGYRIGYAQSKDLINWIRNDDQGGIAISNEGWDSEMICYPSVSELNGRLIMLYCGNNFGYEGFGYAQLND